MGDNSEPQVRVVDRRWWAQADADTSDAAVNARGAPKPTYVEDLERRLADTTAQLQTYLNEHRHAIDEFEQAKIRVRREVGREAERARRAVLAELLDVIDNLDRAIAASGDVDSALLRGVRLVRDQFLATLEGFGVKRLAAMGQAFDAQFHEAIATAPVDDGAQDGRVVAVVREGYVIGDDLLRPATVIVGTRP